MQYYDRNYIGWSATNMNTISNKGTLSVKIAFNIAYKQLLKIKIAFKMLLIQLSADNDFEGVLKPSIETQNDVISSLYWTRHTEKDLTLHYSDTIYIGQYFTNMNTLQSNTTSGKLDLIRAFSTVVRW